MGVNMKKGKKNNENEKYFQLQFSGGFRAAFIISHLNLLGSLSSKSFDEVSVKHGTGFGFHMKAAV